MNMKTSLKCHGMQSSSILTNRFNIIPRFQFLSRQSGTADRLDRDERRSDNDFGTLIFPLEYQLVFLSHVPILKKPVRAVTKQIEKLPYFTL